MMQVGVEAKKLGVDPTTGKRTWKGNLEMVTYSLTLSKIT